MRPRFTFLDKKGLGVSLPENAVWSVADADYTPFRTILSAVWHSGRYSSYKWAVIEDRSPESLTYNKPTNPLSLNDPCSHADVVHSKCGTTGKSINSKDSSLERGLNQFTNFEIHCLSI